MKFKRNQIWIIGGIILIAIILKSQEKTNAFQAVVPNLLDEGCFEKADCFQPIKQGYCNIRFDCMQGKCITENVLCPEICDSGKDEDLDRKIDCADSDCWKSPLCSCTIAQFSVCQLKQCWCQEGTSSRWSVSDGKGACICI